MSRELTVRQTQRLAAQSRAISRRLGGDVAVNQGGHYPAPDRGNPDTPTFFIRNMALLLVGGFMAGLVMLIIVGMVLINGGASSDNEEALINLAEKLVDADLERTKLETARLKADKEKAEEDAARKKEEAKIAAEQKFFFQMIFYAIVAVLFLAVASQFELLWGLGVGVFILVLIVAASTVPGLKEIAQAVMVPS